MNIEIIIDNTIYTGTYLFDGKGKSGVVKVTYKGLTKSTQAGRDAMNTGKILLGELVRESRNNPS